MKFITFGQPAGATRFLLLQPKWPVIIRRAQIQETFIVSDMGRAAAGYNFSSKFNLYFKCSLCNGAKGGYNGFRVRGVLLSDAIKFSFSLISHRGD